MVMRGWEGWVVPVVRWVGRIVLRPLLRCAFYKKRKIVGGRWDSVRLLSL